MLVSNTSKAPELPGVAVTDWTETIAIDGNLNSESTQGRWDGDTLVLDSLGFTDLTWFGRGMWVRRWCGRCSA